MLIWWLLPIGLNIQKENVALSHCERCDGNRKQPYIYLYGHAHLARRLCKEYIHYFYLDVLGKGLGKTFGSLKRFLLAYQSKEFEHFGAFGWLPTSFAKTNYKKLASSRNSSNNLYLIVYNLGTSRFEFTFFCLSASIHLSVYTIVCTYLFVILWGFK